MARRDARSLDHKTLEEIRFQLWSKYKRARVRKT